MFSSHFHRFQFVALKPTLFLAILAKLLTEPGMGNLDQGFRPLPDRLSMKVGDTVLRDHVVHVSASCQYTCAGRKARHDARHRSVLCCGGKSNNRFAPLRARRPADEVQLPAESAVEP